ncbi:MAG TPA: NAD-binding protein [Methanospirillum sp.]|nr:NAD-binding protein [Methanospirillum sp.]
MLDIRKIYLRFRTRLAHSYRLKVILYLWAFLLTIFFYVLLFWYYYPRFEGEEVSIIKSLLFVLETITTVGYGEFMPFQTDQMTIIAILIMVSGIILFFGVINLLVTPMIQSRIQPIPPQVLTYRPEDHVIIFGYSPLIREVIDNLLIIDAAIVLIEDDKDKALVLAADMGPDVQVIWGDYHHETTWEAAGFKNAAYIILFLEERLSVRVTLGIRSFSTAEVIVVITDNLFEKYLKICGADQVVSTKDILGAITAMHALLNIDPVVLADSELMQDVLKKTSSALGSCQISRVPIIRYSRAIGKTIGDLNLPEQYLFRIFAIIDKGTYLIFPSDDYVIHESIVLLLIGCNKNLFRMVKDQFITPHGSQLNAIIAGYGDMGVMIGRDLNRLGISCLTIDADEKRRPTIIGSAEREEVLIEAGIADAQFLLTVTNDDDINLFTTLMARQLNPSITIFTRVKDPDSARWIYQAGANYVINVPSIIAQAIGRLILYGSSQVIINMQGKHLLVVRYYDVKRESSISVSEIRNETGITILAIDHQGEIIFPKDVHSVISPGDAVYGFGSPPQITRFIEYL